MNLTSIGAALQNLSSSLCSLTTAVSAQVSAFGGITLTSNGQAEQVRITKLQNWPKEKELMRNGWLGLHSPRNRYIPCNTAEFCGIQLEHHRRSNRKYLRIDSNQIRQFLRQHGRPASHFHQVERLQRKLCDHRSIPILWYAHA